MLLGLSGIGPVFPVLITRRMWKGGMKKSQIRRQRWTSRLTRATTFLALLAVAIPPPAFASSKADEEEQAQTAEAAARAAAEQASAPAPPPTPRASSEPAPAAAAAPPEDEAVGDGSQIEIALSQGRIDTFLMQFNSQSPRKLAVYGKVVEQRVDVFADGEPAESVLNQVANKYGWAWWKEENGDYGMADKEYYTREILPKRKIQKVFRPNNIKASELDRAIKGLLTPNLGASVADDRTNKLIVEDLAPALERIERFIREIDVQLIVRVFYIRRANVEDIAKKLEQYKSGPGSIEVDVKTRQIIVTDLLSNIKKMELLVDILDVGPEIVQYDINNVGIDGEDLEGLQKIIDSIRTTKDLLFEVNSKQGVMILEDVPEVHERVEQILAEFDKPVRQVLLQSEILSTRFTRNFSFGLQGAAWADNLLSAAGQDAITGGPSFLGDGAFTNTNTTFPNAGYNNGAVTGNYLSSTVALQYRAAYTDTSTRILLQPRLLVKNQAKSTIFVGAETPYLTTFIDDNDNGNTNRTTSQSTVQDGLKVEVTPSISNSYLVELELKIDNDDAFIEEAQNTRLVGRERQNIESTLQIPSGETRMLGGLISNNDTDGNTGLPFLVSIPIVGALFGNKSQGRDSRNLMIFITPTIVEDESPRNRGDNGKRGRSLTNYERLPGVELNLEGEEATENIGGTPPPAELLSGDPDQEAEELRLQIEAEKARKAALEDESTGNFTPTGGLGNATLNLDGGRAPSTSGSSSSEDRNERTPERSNPTPTPPPNADSNADSNPPAPEGRRRGPRRTSETNYQ